MKIFRLLAVAIFVVSAASCVAQQDQTWILTQSTLTYHMSHPMHQVDGVSHATRGKGFCHAGECNFLIAATVKSFDSGDTNRDDHMLQATRGADFPVVTVRFSLPEAALNSPTLNCNLEVHFAGHTAHYANVTFRQNMEHGEHHITGVVPSTLTSFQIPAPSFLTIPIKNEIPVRVDMLWQHQ